MTPRSGTDFALPLAMPARRGIAKSVVHELRVATTTVVRALGRRRIKGTSTYRSTGEA